MDIDRLPIPNVGNNVFYKEFSIGAMLPQIGLSGKEVSPGHEYDGVGVITVSDNINVDEGDIDDDSLLKSFTEAKHRIVSVIEEKKRSQLPDSSFGIPEDRKYPLDTKKHVESAIKLFCHAEKSKKKELAKRIKVKADEYDIEIPETTQCYKYLQESSSNKISYSKSFNDVKNIVDSLPKDDLKRICNGTFKNSPYVFYREVLLADNKPTSFVDVYKLPDMNEDGVVVIATNPDYRDMGFSSILVNRMKDKLKGKKLIWKTQKDNEKSIHLANKINLKPSFEKCDMSLNESTYYRVTYDGDGIYNAFKNNVKPEVWRSFLNDKENTQWLPKPPSYSNGNVSYFTDKGYQMFKKTAYPIFKKYMDNDKIKIGKISDIGNIVYKDQYQVVTEACKDVQTARKFVSEVGKLAKKYNANYFIVTDGASGIHNQGEPAVKFHRDKQIEWEKKNGFDPDDDWRNNPDDMTGYKLQTESQFDASKLTDRTIITDNIQITKSYGIYDNRGKYNAIVDIKPNIRARGRSEILIVDGDKVYLSKSKIGLCGNYAIPGGGWDKNESHDKSAIREAEEEARLKSRNVKYVGCYLTLYDEPHPWVKNYVDEKYWWRGYYTEVYIGEFDRKYTGFIDDTDKDDLIKTGKFYQIKDVINELHPIHANALKKYLQESTIITESKIFNSDDIYYNKDKFDSQLKDGSNILKINKKVSV